jgi:hypothetical protein
MPMIEVFRGALAAVILAAGAPVPSDNYTSIDVVSEKQTRLGYHASIKKDCAPAPLPQVRVLTPPKFGTLSVRHAILTTGPTHACPNVKTEAYVIYYQSRPGYTGSDQVVYQITSLNGEVSNYNIVLDVKKPLEAGKELKI